MAGERWMTAEIQKTLQPQQAHHKLIFNHAHFTNICRGLEKKVDAREIEREDAIDVGRVVVKNISREILRAYPEIEKLACTSPKKTLAGLLGVEPLDDRIDLDFYHKEGKYTISIKSKIGFDAVIKIKKRRN